MVHEQRGCHKHITDFKINNSDLNFKKWIIIIFFLLKEYYEINKERLKEKVRNKYRELSNEEKNIKRE